jgi:hypothetical protein
VQLPWAGATAPGATAKAPVELHGRLWAFLPRRKGSEGPRFAAERR